MIFAWNSPSSFFLLLVCGLASPLGGCASGAGTFRPAGTTPTMQTLSPTLQSLAFYQGTWTCEGEQYNQAGTVVENVKLGIIVVPAIDNWLSVTVTEGGKPITRELKGWNPATKDFHHIWTANDGTSGSFTSNGWNGSHLVFEEDHPTAAMRMRMTFTKVDETHFSHNAEIDRNSAGFKLDFRKTCSKS